MEEQICQALGTISYGLYVVTTADGTVRNGMIVNTVFQVTADPAQIAVSINKQSLTHELLLKSRVFAVMPLEQQTPLVYIGNFGFRTGRTFDKFAKVSYKKGLLGCPIVEEHSLSAIEAQVVQTVDMGTHTLFIGAVKDAHVFKKEIPLTYEYYHTVIKGKTPVGATHCS